MAISDLFFGTQNPNPNREIQKRDVLCIFSLRRVFVVDMEYIMRDEDYKEGTPLKRLPVKRTIDFWKSRLPFGMGFAKWRNFLYMFGGNYPSESERDKLRPNSRPEPVFFGYNLVEEGSPCHAFMLDLADDTSEPVQLSSMSGPKLYPMVEVIGDNIYVLSEILLSGPMFEVYNLITEKWRILPQPSPSSSWLWKLRCYSVCGSVITCKFSSCYCRFDTTTEEWEYPIPEDITTREKICMFGRPDVRNKDIYITHGGDDDDLWAMDEKAWPNGENGCSIMFKPSDIYPPLPGRFIITDPITLADTSDHGGYMCGMVEYDDYGSEEDCYYPIAMALHIIVFQVEKQESGTMVAPAPLSIKYLRRQVYEFKSEDELQPYFAIRKAVVGRLSYNTQTGRIECFREEQGGLENKKKKKKKKKRKEGEKDKQSHSIIWSQDCNEFYYLYISIFFLITIIFVCHLIDYIQLIIRI